MTSPLSENGELNSEANNMIDSEINELQRLENGVPPNLRPEHPNLQNKSLDIDDWQLSLTDHLKLLLDAENTLNSKIEILQNCQFEEHEEPANVVLAMDENQKEREEDLKLYENGLNNLLSRFRNALTTYSKNNLKKEIEEIRKERIIVKNQTMMINEEIKELVSKLNFKDANSTTILENESATTEVHKLEAIL